MTEENVEKEKGIIGQEINMYDDDPEWQVFFNYLYAMYGEKHAITKDIAGTVDTIAKITPEVLYKCYNTFYDPSNMVICVAGDIDADKVLTKIKQAVKHTKEKPQIERYYGEKTVKVFKKEIEKKMDVSMPMVILGFKDAKINKLRNAGYKEDNTDLVKRSVAVEILLNIIAGESSELYEELYNDGLINKTIGIDYTYEEDYAHCSFSFESNNVEEVVNKIKEKAYLKSTEGRVRVRRVAIAEALLESTDGNVTVRNSDLADGKLATYDGEIKVSGSTLSKISLNVTDGDMNLTDVTIDGGSANLKLVMSTMKMI